MSDSKTYCDHLKQFEESYGNLRIKNGIFYLLLAIESKSSINCYVEAVHDDYMTLQTCGENDIIDGGVFDEYVDEIYEDSETINPDQVMVDIPIDKIITVWRDKSIG